jgi:hypothetical protein
MAVNINIPTQVSQTITNGVTAFAPSEDAVFDALALKQDTLTNPVTGTGANGQVSFWTGTGSQSGDNGLFWDNTNKRLGVGTNAPTNVLHVIGDAIVGNPSGNGDLLVRGLSHVSNLTTITIRSGGSDAFISSTGNNGFSIRHSTRLALFTANTERMAVFSNGNISIGTTTDAGFRLDVNGTARVQGALTISSPTIGTIFTLAGIGGSTLTYHTTTGINFGAVVIDQNRFRMRSNGGIVLICNNSDNNGSSIAILAGANPAGAVFSRGDVIFGGGINDNIRYEFARFRGSDYGFVFQNDTNLVFGTATGTRIGTATNQRLSLWNATPDVQPTTAITAAAFVANTSGIVDDTATFGGYTMGQVVAALQRIGALA